jgi:hypothetical protein
MLKRDFDKLLIEAIDEGLSAVGESPKAAIYYHLENSFDVKKREIPKKVEVFEDAIQKIFGVGADYLEVLIMKRLYEKIGGEIPLEESTEFHFSQYVSIIKQRLLGEDRLRFRAGVTR